MKKTLSFALVLIMLLAFCGCSMLDYRKAMKAYDNGDYAEARDMFVQLSDYKDSARLAKDCNYRLAEKAMDKEDYDKALSILEKLDDYKDSEELAQECNYQLALADIAAGDLEAAEEKLTALEGYKDSADVLASLSGGAVLQLLAGQWECPLDYSELLMRIVAENEDDEEVMSYLDFSNLILIFDLSFDNAGNWEMSMDKNSINKMIEDVKQPLIDGLNAYFYDSMEALAEEVGMSLQDLCGLFEVDSVDALIDAMLGMSIEEYVNETFTGSGALFDASDASFATGTVVAQDDVLVISDSVFIASSMSYDADADEITITIPYNDLGIDFLTFTRK